MIPQTMVRLENEEQIKSMNKLLDMLEEMMMYRKCTAIGNNHMNKKLILKIHLLTRKQMDFS